MEFNKALLPLLEGKHLTRNTSQQVFTSLIKGELDPLKAKALLLLLALKGETADEVLGCLRAVRRFEPAQKLKLSNLIDNCGTGGDNKQSFNISTLAAFVIAGAGGKVAKHGNRAVSSKCGSSDLMEALGVNLNARRGRMIEAIEKAGIGYFHAPLYHPAFLKLQGLRRELKTRTIFNLLGPLLNPFDLKYQLIGVAKKSYVKLFAEVLKQLKVKNALVVNSDAGEDEISAQGMTYAGLIHKGKIQYLKIYPPHSPIKGASASKLRGGSAMQNKKTAEHLLRGKLKGLLRETVLINAGAALVILGQANNLHEGFHLAAQSLDSGRALQALVKLRGISQQK